MCKISSFQSIKVEGEGKVLREPAKTSYKPNDVVRLTAVPDEDWVFSEWQGGLSGTDETGSIVMTKDLTVTAFFETGVGKVRGYVSDGRGGPAVKGAVVKWPENEPVTTDDEGMFVLLVPAEQIGDIIVERPDGGKTRVQDVKLASGEVWTIDIPTRRSFNPNASEEPPFIELDILPGSTLAGEVDLRIDVYGEHDIYDVYVYIGGEQYQPWDGRGREKLDLTIDTTEFPDGQTYIKVLAYDLNENTTMYIAPVTIQNGVVGDPAVPGPVTWARVTAETYGENVRFYSQPGLPIIVQENQLHTSSIGLQAVPIDSMLTVVLEWEGVEDANGHKVYRSFDGVRFTKIAAIPASYSEMVDFSPQLTPGKKTFYKVVPYNSAGEGQGMVVDVTPLPPMEVYLSQPYNGRTNVALDLTFQWKLRNKDEFPEGTNFEYLLRVYDAVFTQITVDDYSKYYTEEAQLPFPLIPGHVYSWDIAYSKAEVCTQESNWESRARSLGGVQLGETNTGSRNGEFIFTTTTNLEP